MPLADRNRRQVHPVRHIPHREDRRHTRPRLHIDHHRAHRIQLNACVLEPQPARIRRTPDREQDLIRHQHLAAFGRANQRCRPLLNARKHVAHHQPHSPRGHGVHQPLAQPHIEPAQHPLAAIDQRHLRPEARENRRELHSDISAARHHDPPRLFLEIEHFVRRDYMFHTRQCRIDVGQPTRRDQNGLGSHGPPGGKPHRLRPRHRHPLIENRNARTLLATAVKPFEPRDLAILRGDQSRPVEAGRTRLPAKPARILKVA